MSGCGSPFSEVGPHGEDLSTGVAQDWEGRTELAYEIVVTRRDNWLDQKAKLETMSRPLRDRLRQDKIWVDREGNTHQIATMDIGHARNLLRWLQRRAPFAYWGECAWWLFAPEAGGDMAQWACEQEQAELHDMSEIEWMESQPLYRAIKTRAEQSLPTPLRSRRPWSRSRLISAA